MALRDPSTATVGDALDIQGSAASSITAEARVRIIVEADQRAAISVEMRGQPADALGQSDYNCDLYPEVVPDVALQCRRARGESLLPGFIRNLP